MDGAEPVTAEMPVDSTPPFEDAYRRHGKAVHRYCLSQCRDWGVAEDLTHETFAKALVAYQRVAPSSQGLRPWLLAIAHNVCADHGRRQYRRRRLARRVRDQPAAVADVELLAERVLDLELVLAALACCRDTDRELIGLRVAADLSFAEIAGVMGISEGAARTATYRALGRLRSRLEARS